MNISCEYLSLFFCLFILFSASVNAEQTVSEKVHMKVPQNGTCQIFIEDRSLVQV
jgi:hypothetical protein